MFFRKIILMSVKLIFSILFSCFVFADEPTSVNTAQVYEYNLNPKNESQSQNKRTIYPYNLSIWGGVGFLFVNRSLEPYVNIPTMDYQIGISKSFWNFTPYTFLYAGLIGDFAYSKQFAVNSLSIAITDFIYEFYNEQLVLGYEQSLGTPYLSFFAEAGGVFQQRYFAVRDSEHFFSSTFGGTFNAGLNVKIYEENYTSCFFRLAMNLMLGPKETKMLNFNRQSVNINQLSYSPSISFGVRI